MSELINDLNQLTTVGGIQTKKAKHATNDENSNTLQMEDFLTLMVTQLKNQSIDNQADTGEMLDQMVQMSVIEAITNISSMIETSTNMTYGASLVGKTVTVGQWNGNELIEKQGTVTGTGVLNGEQVVFLDDKDCFRLTDIMAVGVLPPEAEDLVPENDKTDTQTDGETGEKDQDTV